MDVTITPLKTIEDERGFLVEALKRADLEDHQKTFAHLYTGTIQPGQIRGNHYHTHMEEFFIIIKGKVKLILEDIRTKERKELMIDAETKGITRAMIGKFVAHAIQNISNEDAIFIGYQTQPFDTSNQDKVDYNIL